VVTTFEHCLLLAKTSTADVGRKESFALSVRTRNTDRGLAGCWPTSQLDGRWVEAMEDVSVDFTERLGERSAFSQERTLARVDP
jgi:hypothetical protein